MTDRELMQQALEALEGLFGIPDYWTSEGGGGVAVWRMGGSDAPRQAITAIKEALAQPEQEPVAWVDPSWMNPETRTWESESFAPGPINGWSPLYTTPRQWQGLTGDEINQFRQWAHPDIIEAIELRLQEKNT